MQFVHDIISNLDGAKNRGHKHIDLVKLDLRRPLTRFDSGDYHIN